MQSNLVNVAQNTLPILEIIGIMVVALGITGILVALVIEAIKSLITEEKIKSKMSLNVFALIVNLVFALIVLLYIYVFAPFIFEGYEPYKVAMIFIGFLFAVFVASQLGYVAVIEKIKDILENKQPKTTENNRK